MGTINGSFGVTTTNKYIDGVLEWSSTTNTAGNYSTVSFTLKFHRNNTYTGTPTYGTGSWQVNVNGNGTDSGSKSFTIPNNNSYITVHSGSVNVPHNSDGSKQVTISVDGWTDVHDVYWTSSSPWLETIPRASIVSSGVDWMAGVDNLGITISRASSDFKHKLELFVQHTYDGNYDKVGERNDVWDSTTWVFNQAEITQIYTTNNCYEERPVILRTWTYTSGGTQIGDYRDVVGRVRAVPTAYPTFPNFNLGDPITVTIQNYRAGFSYELGLYFGQWGRVYPAVTTSTTTITFTQEEIATMKSQIPNANAGVGNAVIRTKYNGVLTENGAPAQNNANFTAFIVNSNPTFGTGYTYKDNNATTAGVTGNSDYIIQNKSNLLIEIPTTAKATSNGGASMVSYEATVNGITKTANWSDTATVSFDFGTVNASSDITFQVKAIDSRGNFTTTSKTIKMVPYWDPIATVSATRLNGFEASTTLSISGSIAPLNVNSVVKNDITTGNVEYRYKENPSGTWGAWTDFTVTETATTSSYTYSATNVTLTLDNLKSFTVEMRVTDKFTTTTVSREVPVGQPMMFMDSTKKSIGINQFPNNDKSFEVTGEIYQNGALMLGERDMAFPATAGWYRIGQSVVNIGNNLSSFEVYAAVSGWHQVTKFDAGISYGRTDSVTINQLSHTQWSSAAITKVRIVYHTTYTGNYAYLEVYKAYGSAMNIAIRQFGGRGWGLYQTPTASDTLPTGYTSKEIILSKGIVTNGDVFFNDGKSKVLGSNTDGVTSQLTDGTDLNSNLNTGLYMGNETCLNRPAGVGSWFYIEVFKHNDNFCSQTVWDLWTLRRYERRKINTNWSSWVHVAGYMPIIKLYNAGQGLAANTNYRMNWTIGTNELNEYNMFNDTDNLFRITEAGYYEFNFQCYFVESLEKGFYVQVWSTTDGTFGQMPIISTFAPANGYNWFSGSTILYLKAGQTYETIIKHTDTGYTRQTLECWLTVKKVLQG